jgi:hypothetical protein
MISFLENLFGYFHPNGMKDCNKFSIEKPQHNPREKQALKIENTEMEVGRKREKGITKDISCFLTDVFRGCHSQHFFFL